MERSNYITSDIFLCGWQEGKEASLSLFLHVTCIYIYIIYIHTYIHTLLNRYTHTHTHTLLHTYIHTNTHIGMYVYICVCVCNSMIFYTMLQKQSNELIVCSYFYMGVNETLVGFNCSKKKKHTYSVIVRCTYVFRYFERSRSKQ